MTELAGISGNGKLVSRKQWESHISSLRAATGPMLKNRKAMKTLLEKKLVQAVKKRMPEGRFGILLSGGVDSSLITLIAKRLKGRFVCYTAGFENSKDLFEARKAARQLGVKLRCTVPDLAGFEKLLKKTVRLIKEPDAVNAGVASVEIAAASPAAKDKIRVLFTGLGSEEIFAGYQRHETAKDVNRECWNGLRKMWARDLVRDSRVAAALKAEFLTPYLDPNLITAAMRIPGKCKLEGSEKKIILRETAASMGLPENVAFRKKLAAQYGSGFDAAIKKLARKNGFRYRKEYLESLAKS